MKLSQTLLPILKEEPREAQIISHRLMLRAGMIRQLASGIYTWLPLGLRVLKKIEEIVRQEMNLAGANETLMPTMQPAELWAESGRGDYGKETLIATDRHNNNLIYGPTNEEVVTDLFRKNIKSYKDLPLNLYHMQWKFRDEIRPRFGVMRGREFYMKDAYSFDLTEEDAKESYDNMFAAYIRIFKKLGLKAIPFQAETGAIGGDMSHEFQVIAETGESQVYYDSKFDELFEQDEIDISEAKSLYARADELHDEASAPENVKTARGIEVGHIFYLGDKYSAPLKAEVQGREGKNETVKMGCYGIGLSRLIGAIIESSHDDKGIIWPESVSPYNIMLINLKPGDVESDKACEDIYKSLLKQGVDVLYDDKDGGVGTKYGNFDLLGIPKAIVVGPRGLKQGEIEFLDRKTGEKTNIKLEDAAKKV